MTCVPSPVFGTFAMQSVADGMLVAAGENIGDMESMKSYWPIHAPCAGTLKWTAQLGEVLGEGDEVARIT